MDLKHVFDYGQAYTALSRVREFKDVRLKTDMKRSMVLTSPVVSAFDKSVQWIPVDNGPR